MKSRVFSRVSGLVFPLSLVLFLAGSSLEGATDPASLDTGTMVGSTTSADPLFPSMFSNSSMLETDQPSKRPIAFIDRPGRELVYTNPAIPGDRISVFVLRVTDENEAREHLRILTRLDNLPRLELASNPTSVRELLVQQGRQDNPAAASGAGPTPLTRVVAWRPPYLIYLLAQNNALASSAILTFLNEIH